MNETARVAATQKIRPGDQVLIEGWPPETFEVLDTNDPALLVLQSPNGATLKIGRARVIPVEGDE